MRSKVCASVVGINVWGLRSEQGMSVKTGACLRADFAPVQRGRGPDHQRHSGPPAQSERFYPNPANWSSLKITYPLRAICIFTMPSFS